MQPHHCVHFHFHFRFHSHFHFLRAAAEEGHQHGNALVDAWESLSSFTLLSCDFDMLSAGLLALLSAVAELAKIAG